jgi:ATP-dependent DNA ligase
LSISTTPQAGEPTSCACLENQERETRRRSRSFLSRPIVGKRSGSRYEAGKRTGAWVKIKLYQEQEFVIGGYTEPEGARKRFGALLVGFYEGKS